MRCKLTKSEKKKKSELNIFLIFYSVVETSFRRKLILIYYTKISTKGVRMIVSFISAYIRQLPFAPIGELTGQVVQNAAATLTSLTQMSSTGLPVVNTIL